MYGLFFFSKIWSIYGVQECSRLFQFVKNLLESISGLNNPKKNFKNFLSQGFYQWQVFGVAGLVRRVFWRSEGDEIGEDTIARYRGLSRAIVVVVVCLSVMMRTSSGSLMWSRPNFVWSGTFISGTGPVIVQSYAGMARKVAIKVDRWMSACYNYPAPHRG